MVNGLQLLLSLLSKLFHTEAYSEPSRTSKMTLNRPLARFAKNSILDVRLGSEYTSDEILVKTAL